MRKGHYASQCFSKTVKLPTDKMIVDESALDEDELTVNDGLSLDSAFLDTMTSGSHKSSWNAPVSMCELKAKTVFKLDTGAVAAAITNKTYKSQPNVVLQKPQTILQGPAKQQELFQLLMNKIIEEGLKGVICQMDDILAFRSTQEEHDQRLIALLEHINAAGCHSTERNASVVLAQ